MLRFYTLPPARIPYPFVLINANRPEPGLRYVIKNKKAIKGVLIDSGVEIFRDPTRKDYPPGWLNKLVRLYYRVKYYLPGADIVVTIPDYPDDYNPGSLWLPGKTNIERTFENILYCIENYNNVNWLIPIQGHNKNPNSIKIMINYLREAGITKKFKKYAIANLCVEKKNRIIIHTLRIAREELEDNWIHAFGIKKNQAITSWKYGFIDSFDSVAWTRPDSLTFRILKELGIKKRFSCKNDWQRELYFLAWLISLSRKVTLEKIDERKYEEMLENKIYELKRRSLKKYSNILKLL